MRIKSAQPSTPRRILMTADTLGGVWTYALELAHALGNYGVEVGLATMGAPLSKEQKQEVLEVRNLAVFESGFKLEWMEEPWEDVQRAGEWLLELERQFHPELIHINGYSHGALPWAAPTIVVGHSCVLSWWQAVHKTDAPPQWSRYREAVEAGLRAADLVVAPSHSMLASLLELYGPLPNTEVIYNGRLLPGLRWQTKDEIILAAGRLWDEAKNIAALTAIAPDLTWPIFVAGDGRHPNGIETRFEQVHFLGRVAPEELANWYARAAIYALPAHYEPFGLSALEAGLADCALVLGDIPSLREIWGRAALFVDPDDPGALRHTLLSLISDWRRLIGLGVRARERAQELTPLRMATQYLSAYGRVLEGVRAVSKREELLLCGS